MICVTLQIYAEGVGVSVKKYSMTKFFGRECSISGCVLGEVRNLAAHPVFVKQDLIAIAFRVVVVESVTLAVPNTLVPLESEGLVPLVVYTM